MGQVVDPYNRLRLGVSKNEYDGRQVFDEIHEVVDCVDYRRRPLHGDLNEEIKNITTHNDNESKTVGLTNELKELKSFLVERYA